MRVSIVTPSFNNSAWLKLCISSVHDQSVEHEHIVQDNCSNDSTLDWLARDKRVQTIVEKDSGMYDAINRGLRRSSGDILMYLNCDEQLLPGALESVVRFFDSHSDVEIVFANAVVIDPNAQYICSRIVQIPWQNHIRVTQLPTLSCATFFRRSVIAKRNMFFDTKWRTVSDATWVLRALQERVPMAVLNQFTSTFTDRPGNLGISATANTERQALLDSAPFWARSLKPAIIAAHRFRRFASGCYSQKPFDYAIYSPHNLNQRTVHHVDRPTSVWRSRL